MPGYDPALLSARLKAEARREVGAPLRLLAGVRLPPTLPPLLQGMLEAFDGAGVPHGLKGPDIPLGARILAAADGALHLPAGVVGQTGVVDLAGPHRVVEEPQRLLQRRPRVVGVHLVEVDMVGPQPAQRRVQRGGQVSPGESHLVGPGAHGEAAFGRQDDPLAHLGRPTGQPPSDDLLAETGAVDVGGVHQRAAGLDEAVQLDV